MNLECKLIPGSLPFVGIVINTARHVSLRGKGKYGSGQIPGPSRTAVLVGHYTDALPLRTGEGVVILHKAANDSGFLIVGSFIGFVKPAVAVGEDLSFENKERYIVVAYSGKV